MPIIPLTCPNCGGSLEVDSDKDAAICKFCKKPYVVKDAIVQNYITNVTNITADTVNVYSEKDFEIKAGLLVKYNGESAEVSIPDSVRIIGEGAFKGLPIVSVTIPESVMAIEKEAFSNCAYLQKITIPPSVKSIGSEAFCSCCSLESVTIPGSVKSVGKLAFVFCDSLKSVTLSNGVETIEQGAFQSCGKLHTVSLPESLLCIQALVFYKCGALKTIRIPSSVHYLNNDIFGESGLSEVDIPQNARFYYRENSDDSDIVSKEQLEDYLVDVFGDCPYVRDIEERKKARQEDEKREKWKKQGRCQYCGGEIRGMFSLKCSVCGKPKDYTAI